jgi:S-adenosylmethionine decarboxylase
MHRHLMSAHPPKFVAGAGLGAEWVVDGEGCDPALLRDSRSVSSLIGLVVREMHLHPVGAPLLHVFPGEGGITALVLLSESHLAVHTFPETREVALSLYTCRVRPCIRWQHALERAFSARSTTVRTLPRGSHGLVP